MFYATTVGSTEELQQILDLQRENLSQHIDEAEKQSQGFVTMQYSPEILQQLHNLAPSIIIKADNKVVAYALVMPREYRRFYPPLESMFATFDSLQWKGRPLSDYRFYVMGQVCVAKAYRGQGLFDQLYAAHRDIYGSQFDFLITEVATRNGRSLRAHERVGFQTIHTYRDDLDEWAVILWSWK